ncbi:GNAT family N-acetyltransferase [Oscillochloris sp. ZM17-4]|uniref:GNAT family N-acetyltransferase n=1 Tax=Oscillochloris sp. ZM17-4 TaxID=2866714 RepID=UPI001C73398A|nr:GNAT family N-acetyltransferase [Oscillochloris sp. ZM17-4]MBX0326282.1 GNAT family N-acetyltransferase [Oscillochloris sp. ZM17-4]
MRPADMLSPYELLEDGFRISTDPARLDLDVIHGYLTGSYWAAGRTRAQVARSLSHSLCFGLYAGDAQIGLARVISDYATFAYLCDVFVLEAYRGHGLGTWLMGAVVAHPDLRGLRRFMLATRDAHGLYAKFGFALISAPEKWMEIVQAAPPAPMEGRAAPRPSIGPS